MNAHKKQVWPKFKNIDRPNRKYELHNAIIRWLQDMKLGWNATGASFGEQFVSALGDLLWKLDPH